MKLSGESKPTEEQRKKSILDDLLEPTGEDLEDESSDDGDVIDRSELTSITRGCYRKHG